MQALPTFTESGGHLSVPARAGATPITQSAPSPTAQRVRFMVGSSGAGGSSSSRPGVKGMVDSPEGHAANGSSLHCSSHRCPQRQRRWKWLPPRASAQSRSKCTRISYRAPHHAHPRSCEKGPGRETRECGRSRARGNSRSRSMAASRFRYFIPHPGCSSSHASTPSALASRSIAQRRMLLRSRSSLTHQLSRASPIGIAVLIQSASPWYRRFALEQDSRGACPRGKTEEVMGTVIRTTTVVAALFWLSVAPSLGQAAAPSSPCSRSACADDAGLSGFSGGVLSRCTNDVVKACKAGTCTCGTVTTTGTCGSMIASLCPPTTTTTTVAAPTTTTSTGAATTTTSSAAPSTTSTTCAPSGLSLKYTTTAGTTSCGGAGFSSPASAPFSGEIDSDTACSVLIDDLGSACLYFGGGNQSLNGAPYPPVTTPAGATSYLDLGCPGQLVASNGTGKLDCTKGSGPASECVNAGTCTSGPNPGAVCFDNNATDCSSGCTGAGTPAACCAGVDRGSCACLGPNPHKPCTSDTDCGGAFRSGACQPVENCFFGPPLAIPHPAVSSVSICVINVIATDASGTSDPATGAASVDIPLNSRVYLTGNLASPCPQCNCGTPPCSGSGATGCNAGPNAGGACSTTATTGNPATENTTHDCPPQEGGGRFNGALSVDLNPLTTGSVSVTSATGFFCTGQDILSHAGAFGQPDTRCITETGMEAGGLTAAI